MRTSTKTNLKTKPLTEAEQEQAALREIAKAFATLKRHSDYIPTRYWQPIDDAFSEWVSDAPGSLMDLLSTAQITRLLASANENIEMRSSGQQSTGADSLVVH